MSALRAYHLFTDTIPWGSMLRAYVGNTRNEDTHTRILFRCSPYDDADADTYDSDADAAAYGGDEL